MNAREVLKILKKDGWYELERKSTSHIQLRHPTKKGKVTISAHGGEDIAKGTFNNIMKQAGLK
jgi:predicted RNA binding protein YcfA (HicA-like mRNA interferase family)